MGTALRMCGLTFELTCTLWWANFGLEVIARNWTAAKCQVERVVRRLCANVGAEVLQVCAALLLYLSRALAWLVIGATSMFSVYLLRLGSWPWLQRFRVAYGVLLLR